MSDTPDFSTRAARWTRFGLIAAIAIVLGLIVTTPRNEYPLVMSRAQANSIGAAPGFLMTSLTAVNGSHFFLTDTTKQIICVYEVTGDKLRLISARKFDNDSEILDGSIPVNKIKLEGGNGISREEAKAYWDEAKPQLEKLLDKKPKK